ncbi:MAG: hydantoinase/oxoprolinase family protein [Candidatus Bathyarchaeia archaeon]
MSWRVGIDIGGAFTDLLAINDETGDFTWIKVESTPPDYSKGVIETLSRSKLDLQETRYLVHGQTVVINTIVTRTGAKTGLITTEGYDILEIGRANRRDLFNLRYKKPEPLVPRYLKAGVRERIMADGTILKSLNEDDVRDAVKRLTGEEVDSIAISFINSYVNPVHEQKAGKIVIDELRKSNKQAFVTLSHEISREWREYERTSTAVLNAYTQPTLNAYLSELESALQKMRFKGVFYVMLAAAGMATSEFAKKYPVFTIEGGPIAGIVGGTALAELLGERNIIVLDGGSTTTKAGLVKDLIPTITTDYYVERDRFRPGYPVKVPVVEIVEVGNGGTSIVWIDEVGGLKVGPKAAGAYPGPACYGKGGKEPTLTDAYVVAGYLNPRYLLGGELKIHEALAKKALDQIASYYNVSIEEASDAIIRIANDQAAHIIKLISVQRGYDPRDFTLIAHGGAGPMFAPFIASELQMPKIVIPAIPAGVFNAWGMLVTDIRHDVVHTHVMKLIKNPEVANLINNTYKTLENQIINTFNLEGVDPDKVSLVRHADMRYYGQEHTIKVPLMSEEIGIKEVEEIDRRFTGAHEREYGFTLSGNPIEIVNFHVTGITRVKKPRLKPLPSEGRSLDKALIEEREVYLGHTEGFKSIPVYKRELLPINTVIDGPALIEEITATVVVTREFKSKMDQYGNTTIVWK